MTTPKGTSQKRRLRQRERQTRALSLLEEARDTIHSEHCYAPLEERTGCCASCLEITDFLNKNPEARKEKKK